MVSARRNLWASMAFFWHVAALGAKPEGTYDYIVAGAGSAGATLAAKLAKAGKSILLLEAGPDDTWKGTDVDGNPADPYNLEDYLALQYTPEIDDAVMSEPVWQLPRKRDPRLGKVVNLSDFRSAYREFMPRAKIVGGCSMHNYMYCYRGSPEIYDMWGQNWTWEVLFPKFKAIETELEPDVDPAYHGYTGECMVSSREPWFAKADRAFLAAATKAGHPYNKDFNGASLVGMGPAPTSTFKSKRWSAASAFLTEEVRSLPNFHLITGATVTRVIFDGITARGVAYRTADGVLHTATVVKEVILCLGAFRSPQLLMLSGVGPSAILQDVGIPLVAESDGVGRNLQDHLMVNVVASVPPGANRSSSQFATYGGYFFSPWCKQRNCSYPDLQLMCGHDSSLGNWARAQGCAVALTGYIQSGPGFLNLTSKDPKEYAAIYLNYLAAQDDVDRLADGIKEMCRIYAQDPSMFGPAPPEFNIDGWICSHNKTAQDFAKYVRARATTVYHPVGTCKMGPRSDRMAVVGPTLKVHAVKSLRVADASVMPTITNVNTDLPSRMVGYHLADMMLEEEQWETQIEGEEVGILV